ncbi:unnamed protein product [Pneumocystis jirovecii]|uniref:Uncharacterized protein n=1 Tax=Pneumocystis jirovecii TaxID=42068 RepID=L0PGF1_PNEJI|nr:unnamed protein product [Pneumocystis jirovecii]
MSSSLDSLSEHSISQEPLTIYVLDVIRRLEKRTQSILEKQAEIMECIRSKEAVFAQITQYQDIRNIPVYTEKTIRLMQEIACLKKQTQCLQESCMQIYKQRQNLSEEWEKIKKKEQEHDTEVLRAQYTPDTQNPALPMIIKVKRDPSKVLQAHIEE